MNIIDFFSSEAGAALLDVAVLLLLLAGAVLCLIAAIGLLRFRDVPTRLHAATKPQVLGLILVLIAIGISGRSWPAAGMLLAIVLIQFATAPLSAHMVGRQAYRNGTLDQDSLFVDELKAANEADEHRTP